MAITDVIFQPISTTGRREGSSVFSLGGNSFQIIDHGFVEQSLTNLSGVLTNKFDDSDQLVAINRPVDGLSRCVEIIEFTHHELHEGSHYSFSTGNLNVAAGQQVQIVITTPNTTKWTHLVFDIYGALTTTVQFFEGTTYGTGVAYTSYNNNRNSTNIASTILSPPTGIGTSGTKLCESSFGIDTGAGSNSVFGGGRERGDSEWVLKPGTKYLVNILSGTNSNHISASLSWYEHTSYN